MSVSGQLVYVSGQQYKINVALHSHPKILRYWSLDTVLAAIGDNKYIDSCSDIGH